MFTYSLALSVTCLQLSVFPPLSCTGSYTLTNICFVLSLLHWRLHAYICLSLSCFVFFILSVSLSPSVCLSVFCLSFVSLFSLYLCLPACRRGWVCVWGEGLAAGGGGGGVAACRANCSQYQNTVPHFGFQNDKCQNYEQVLWGTQQNNIYIDRLFL